MNDSWDYASSRWLATRRESKYYEKDRAYVERLNDYLVGKALRQIDKVMVADIRDALGEVRVAGTVNRIMGVLRAILNMARDEWGLVESVPRIKRAKETERVRFINRVEAQRLVDAMPRAMRPIVLFALATGLRQANILQLEWNEVSITKRLIAIPGEKMKNDEPFGAPLNEAAISVLQSQLGKHDRWVFPVRCRGILAARKGINNGVWKRALARAGLEDFRFHDLRHTWASWHLQGGTHQHALRELGGWKDDAMVKRYSHLGRQHLQSAAENVIGNLSVEQSLAKRGRRKCV